MSDYTQANYTFRISTPLGVDTLLLRRLRGSEGISEPFDLDLEVLAPNDVEVPFDAPHCTPPVEVLFSSTSPEKVLVPA